MEKRKLVLITGNHLCHNPRVVKEADTLDAAGFSVTVLGGWIDPTLAARDRALLQTRNWKYTPVADFTLSAFRTRSKWRTRRVRKKISHITGAWFNYQNHWQLGYWGRELLSAAQDESADLFIAHSELALWAVDRLWRNGERVGVDMEDWFSEDFLPEVRKERPITLLHRLERDVLRQAIYSSCTSRAMSDALATEYDCRPPEVIYNVFEWSERCLLDGRIQDRKDKGLLSIHWYSQTLGHERGLEDLFAALPHLTRQAEIHLRGKPVAGFRQWIAARTPDTWHDRIIIHDLVPNDELLSRIAEHDIGFAGELKFCRSRNLTVTNKIMHYLLAGLAVVASDTAGQTEIAKKAPDAVFIYKSGDPLSLAAQLNLLLNSSERLAYSKAMALNAAHKTFSWERIRHILVDSVRTALDS